MIKCKKCGGLLVYEMILAEGNKLSTVKCVNCGKVQFGYVY